MKEVVNLRRFRKAKMRAEKERQAEVNRVKFGRTKAERVVQALEEVRRENVLEGNRVVTPNDNKDEQDIF